MAEFKIMSGGLITELLLGSAGLLAPVAINLQSTCRLNLDTPVSTILQQLSDSSVEIINLSCHISLRFLCLI